MTTVNEEILDFIKKLEDLKRLLEEYSKKRFVFKNFANLKI